MDLISGISDLQQSQTMGSIQIAVAKKIMDSQRMDGSAAIKLINAATQSVAKAGDSLVAAATGLGGNVDTYG